MKDKDRTKEQLIDELVELRQRIAELGASETERKRAERALQESEERYRSLFEGAEDHIFVVDRDFRYVAVNASALKAGGFMLEEIVGKGPHELFPEDAEFHLSQYRRTFETGEPVRFERELGLPDGLHWFSVTLSPIKDARGRVTALTGISRDVTERKRMEEALRRSEAELSAIFDNTPMVMILVDQERRVRKVNRGTLEFTGRPAEEMIGLRGGEALRCLHSLDDPKGCGFGPFCEICTVRNLVLDTFEGGRSHHRVEASLPFARGEKREELTFLVSTTLLSVPKDQMVLVCIEDITERKRAEEALQQHARDLELLHRASRAFGSTLDLDQVLATVLEEVRQMLGVVAASIWLSDPETDELVCQQATGPKSDTVRGWRLAPGEGIAGWVARHGESLIVPDTQADKRYFRDTAQQAGLDLRSMLAVPLQTKQRVIGVLEVMDTEVGRFNPPHLTLLELLAASAAIAIENARLYERARQEIAERKRAEEVLRERTAQLEALREVGLELAAQLDLDALLRSIVSRAAELLGGTSGGLYLYRPQRDVLEWTVSVGPHQAPAGIVLYRGEGLAGKVWESGEPLIVDDYQHWEGRAAIWKDYPVAAVIGAPIRWGEEFLGVLDIAADAPGTFSPADAELLSLFATQAAIAILNARLYEAEQERRHIAETLRQASAVLSSTLELDEVLELILQQLRQVIPYDSASVQQLQDERLKLMACQGFKEPGKVVGLVFPLDPKFPNCRVVTTKAPLAIEDISQDYPHFKDEANSYESGHIRSWLGVPLMVRDQVVGMIALDRAEVRPYTAEESELTMAFANQAAIAIENAHLFEREREQRELAEALQEAAAAVSSTLDLDQVLDYILEQVEQVVAGDAFSVILIEDGAAHLARRRGYQLPGEEIQPSHFEVPIAKYPNLVEMAQTGKPVAVPDTSVDSDWVPAARDQGWRRSYVGAPIQVGGVTVGFLNVSGTRPGQFGPEDARRLQAFASHAATAIENARLYEQARRDAETKSVLLQEVNHRVKNNLTAIIGLLYAEQRYASAEDPSAHRAMMRDLANRIRGLARVHSLLSAAEWAPLPLDELTRQIIRVALRMLPRDKHISVDVTPSPVRVTPNQANSLALVINELATNAVKYALQDRDTAHIDVHISLEDDTVLFEFRNDGPGYPDEVLRLERHNVGLYLIQNMVRDDLGGELALHNDHGAVTTIRFKTQAAVVTSGK